MTTVASVGALEKEIRKRAKFAVFKTRNKIYEVINQNLHKYYNEYSPEEYQRTLSVLQSLVRVSDNDGLGFEVYFDSSGIGYKTGDWDTSTVFENVLTTGKHTKDIEGTNVWENSLAEIGDLTALIKKELIAQGLPVK